MTPLTVAVLKRSGAVLGQFACQGNPNLATTNATERPPFFIDGFGRFWRLTLAYRDRRSLKLLALGCTVFSTQLGIVELHH
jgi:hypothetical protein